MLTRKALHVLKSEGFAETIARAKNEINAPRNPKRATPHYHFVSNPFDFTGAPLVLLDLISDFAAQVDPSRLHLFVPSGTEDLLGLVRAKRVNVERVIDGGGMRVIASQMRLRRDDFVLMNTVSVPFAYRNFIFNRLESGSLDRAVWFIHEDGPDRWFANDALRSRTKSLLDAGKLTIVVPSSQVARAYRDYFDTVNVHPISLRVTIPEGMMLPRREEDFGTLRLVMSGNPLDGRKGQLLAIAALHKSSCAKGDGTLEGYRDFELHLIGVGGEDYVSKQVGIIGEGLLPGRIRLYPHLNRDAASPGRNYIPRPRIPEDGTENSYVRLELLRSCFQTDWIQLNSSGEQEVETASPIPEFCDSCVHSSAVASICCADHKSRKRIGVDRFRIRRGGVVNDNDVVPLNSSGLDGENERRRVRGPIRENNAPDQRAMV